MMKKAFSLLLVLLMLVSLSACHGMRADRSTGDKDENGALTYDVPEEFDESRNYEIVFWAKNDTNNNQVAVYQQAIDEFEALYPNITVKMKKYTNYNDIYNDVINNISTNTTPDVCITYPDHIATYIDGSTIVVPLNSFFDDERYGLGGTELKFDGVKKDEIVEEFLSEGIIDGSYFDIPFMRSTEVCYINKTYVEKLGYTLPETLTWDFIWEVSEKAMEKDAAGNYKVNGQQVLIPFIYKSTDNMMITMLRQLGADYSDDSGTTGLFGEETKGILNEIAVHAGTRAFSTFKISSYPANFLNAGQCIFAIDSTAGATWMGSEAPLIDISEDKCVDFETAVMTVPQYDTQNPYMISQGPSVCIFNKEDKQEVLASWLFAQYLLTNNTQIAYAETEGYIPVTHKAQESAEYLDYLSREGEDNTTHYDVKIKASKLLIENTENTFTTAVFNGSTSLRIASGQLIENVVKARRKNQTVDDAFIDNLYSEMITLYHLESIASGGGNVSGPLPAGSKALLITLSVVWAGIIVYVVNDKRKADKQKKAG